MSAKNIKSGRGVSWVQNVWLNKPGLDTFQASTGSSDRKHSLEPSRVQQVGGCTFIASH
jgi:hypothetical protein